METMTQRQKPRSAKIAGSQPRYLVAAALVLLAFAGSYAYAAARSGADGSSTAALAGGAASGTAAGGASGASGCCSGGAAGAQTASGCCGGDGSGVAEKGNAKVAGSVQRITIDTSKGYYSPNEIALKAGVPAEIMFTPASGCLGRVLFPDFGVSRDISGGAVVKLPAMKAGTHQFSCGMQMVFGRLVVS